jgi:hypothetical protein
MARPNCAEEDFGGLRGAIFRSSPSSRGFTPPTWFCPWATALDACFVSAAWCVQTANRQSCSNGSDPPCPSGSRRPL